MKGFNIPRHYSRQPGGWQSVGYTENVSFQATKSIAPFDVRNVDTEYRSSNQFFKSNVTFSDRILPTDYGRISFYSRMGTLKLDYSSGYYHASGITTYVNPNYARSTASLFSNTYKDGVSIKADFNNEQRAIAQCLAKFTSDDMQINSTLAEAKETAGYLGESLVKLFLGAKAIATGNRKQLKQLFNNSSKALTHSRLDLMHNRSAVVKRLVKGVGKVPRSAGSRFLEYKFAIAPLVMEVEGFHRLMREGLTTAEFDDHPWLLSASSAVKENVERDWVPSSSAKCSEQAVRIHYVKVVAAIQDAPLYALAAIGATNVEGGFWEATKFSWLIDYGLPISTFLQALHATQGLSFHMGYKGVAISGFVLEYTSSTKYGFGAPSYYGFSGFERNKLTGFPTVVPYVKSPFSVNNLQNVLALAAVLNPFGSKKRLF